jgi:UDP-perosamine 4-acetyltransferase
MVRLPVIVIGAGGHARVVADALRAAGSEVLGHTDPAPELQGRLVLGLPVLGGDEALLRWNRSQVVLANGIGGVGSLVLRIRVQQRVQSLGWTFVTVIHPAATLSPHATVGAGAQVLARAVLNPGADIGVGAIVNTAAVVEHDVVVGPFSHVAPGATLCGDVRIGAECHVGAGAVVLQGVTLGPRTIVGAGAVVIRDHEGGGTLVGVPARKVTRP